MSRTATARARSILHIDLDPFFVSVERSLDPAARRPLIVGGNEDGSGIVAAASDEARAQGVRAGQPVGVARRLCPDGVFRPGDLDTYARVSDDVTSLLLAASRRVERPSADEAYVDLTREAPSSPTPVAVAESLKDELQRRLGLDPPRWAWRPRGLAARVATVRRCPRGLLVATRLRGVVPGPPAAVLPAGPAPHPRRRSSACRPRHPRPWCGVRSRDARRDAWARPRPPAAGSARGEGRAARGGVTAPPVRSTRRRSSATATPTGRPCARSWRAWPGARAAGWPFGLAAGTVTVELRRGRPHGPSRREPERVPT